MLREKPGGGDRKLEVVGLNGRWRLETGGYVTDWV